MLTYEHNTPVVWTMPSLSAVYFNSLYAGIAIHAASNNLKCGRHIKENMTKNINVEVLYERQEGYLNLKCDNVLVSAFLFKIPPYAYLFRAHIGTSNSVRKEAPYYFVDGLGSDAW